MEKLRLVSSTIFQLKWLDNWIKINKFKLIRTFKNKNLHLHYKEIIKKRVIILHK